MKILYKFISIFSFCILGFQFEGLCQYNLVPNPSFEDTLNCYGPWNCNCSLEIAFPWFNPTQGTADIFTSFSSCGYSANLAMQMPRTGQVFAGLYAEVGELREYIEIKLNDSLLSNHVYCIGFYISKSNFCSGAIDRIGAYLSHDSLISLNAFNFPVIPQIESAQGSLLADTVNWISISGMYYALGGEKFLTIGNFRDSSSTLFQNMDSSHIGCQHAYYLIDDVYIYNCDSVSAVNEINSINAFDIYYTDENIHIKVNTNIPQVTYKITDIQGKEVRSADVSKADSIFEISKNSLNKGLYLFNLKSANFDITKKFVVF